MLERSWYWFQLPRPLQLSQSAVPLSPRASLDIFSHLLGFPLSFSVPHRKGDDLKPGTAAAYSKNAISGTVEYILCTAWID